MLYCAYSFKVGGLYRPYSNERVGVHPVGWLNMPKKYNKTHDSWREKMPSHHNRAQSIFVQQPRFIALVIKLIHGSEPIIMSVNLWRGDADKGILAVGFTPALSSIQVCSVGAACCWVRWIHGLLTPFFPFGELALALWQVNRHGLMRRWSCEIRRHLRSSDARLVEPCTLSRGCSECSHWMLLRRSVLIWWGCWQSCCLCWTWLKDCVKMGEIIPNSWYWYVQNQRWNGN